MSRGAVGKKKTWLILFTIFGFLHSQTTPNPAMANAVRRRPQDERVPCCERAQRDRITLQRRRHKRRVAPFLSIVSFFSSTLLVPRLTRPFSWPALAACSSSPLAGCACSFCPASLPSISPSTYFQLSSQFRYLFSSMPTNHILSLTSEFLNLRRAPSVPA